MERQRSGEYGKKENSGYYTVTVCSGRADSLWQKRKEDEYTYTIKLNDKHRAVSSFPPVVICGFTL